jgi:hypothetical protein
LFTPMQDLRIFAEIALFSVTVLIGETWRRVEHV